MRFRNTTYLPLKTESFPYFYKKDQLVLLKEELEEFLDGPGKYLDNRNLAEKFLGCQEIQANNSIEGYNDDVEVIKEVITNDYSHLADEKRKRVITNLYDGYQMILKQPKITPMNLRKLYDMLSKGLLNDYDVSNMGKFYRNGPVYIYYSKDLAKEPDDGIGACYVEEYMDSLFEYLDNDNEFETATDYFIKSQIVHFYLVYVHPYFDVNGRTSRTLALWYLLNNKANSYVIFNIAITLSKNKYYKVIRDVKKFKNATYFLNFMMENVKLELEKEYLINSISESLNEELSFQDYQTLQYILSMNGNLTCKDFATFYNHFNAKKKVEVIDKEMLLPLIDKKVLKVLRYTNTGLGFDKNNYVFEVNKNMMDNDPCKIKRLKK
ncbi:MAG: Fic family protein [Bacilli bacterium]|nr:Fic family protein [Bacilli bacterium]